MNPTMLDASEAAEPGRISLAYRDLEEFPEEWIGKLADITVLDLSHNNLSDFHFLQEAKKTQHVDTGQQ